MNPAFAQASVSDAFQDPQAERTSSGFFPSPATRFKLDFSRVRGDFLKFIESKHYSKAHEIALINNLDMYVTVIEKPMDIINIFSRLTVGQQHNLNRAIRALINLKASTFRVLDTLDVQSWHIMRSSLSTRSTC